MEDLENIRKNLKLLNSNNLDHFYDNCINDLYYKRFFQVVDSNINDSDKKFLLNEINNAKVILGKVDLEDLKKIIEEDIFNMKTDEEAYQEKTTEKIFNTEIIKTDQNNKLSKKLIGKKKIKKSSSKMFKIIVKAEGLRSYEYSLEKSVILPEQIIIRNNFEENIVTYWRDVKTKRWYKKNLQFQEDDYLPYIEEYDKKAKIGSVIYTLVYYNQWISLLVAIIGWITIDFRDIETYRGIFIYLAISWIVPRFFPYFFKYD